MQMTRWMARCAGLAIAIYAVENGLAKQPGTLCEESVFESRIQVFPNTFTFDASSTLIVRSADFDGDGDSDLAVAETGDDFASAGNVVVLENTGADSQDFRLAGVVSSADPVGDLGTGDFDGDGLPEIVVVRENTGSVIDVDFTATTNEVPVIRTINEIWDTASLIIGPGDRFLYGLPRLAVGDFNGDGTDDVAFVSLIDLRFVVINPGDDRGDTEIGVRVAINNGTSLADPVGGFPNTFVQWDQVEFWDAIFVDAANVDGGNADELVVAAREPESNGDSDAFTDFFFGDFTGLGFSENKPAYFALATGARSLDVGDVDADGDVDLAVAGRRGSFNTPIALRNNGAGIFTNQGVLDLVETGRLADGTTEVRLADADGDGDPDAFHAIDGFIYISKNLGGSFQGSLDLIATDQFFAPIAPSSPNSGVDLVLARTNSGFGVSALRNDGTGRTYGPQRISAGNIASQRNSDVIAADFNQDGFEDLVTVGTREGSAGREASVTFLRGNGAIGGGFSSALWSVEDAMTAQAPVAGDLNGDGLPDLAIIASEDAGDDTIRVYFADPFFGILSSTEIVVTAPFSRLEGADDLGIADIDGDGDNDLVFTAPTNKLNGGIGLFTNDGSGNFSFVGTRDNTNTDADDRRLTIGDIDNDGAAEFIVIRAPESPSFPEVATLGLYEADVTLTEDPITVLDELDLPFEAASNVGIVDADSDGDLDLVTVNTSGIALFRNDGTGLNSFPREPIGGFFAVGDELRIADANGDGIDDVLVLNESLNEVYLYLGTGETFEAASKYYPGPNATSFTTLRDGGIDDGVDVVTATEDDRLITRIGNVGGCELQVCPGDTNGDDAVTALDISVVLSNFGSTGVPGPGGGDVTGDGNVTALDISLVLSNFGNDCN